MPRSTTAEQIAKFEADKEKLDAEIKKRREQLRQQELRRKRLEADKERKLDTRRKIVLGGIVMAHMQRDPDFAEQINDLARRLLNDRDKSLFSELVLKPAEPVDAP